MKNHKDDRLSVFQIYSRYNGEWHYLMKACLQNDLAQINSESEMYSFADRLIDVFYNCDDMSDNTFTSMIHSPKDIWLHGSKNAPEWPLILKGSKIIIP